MDVVCFSCKVAQNPPAPYVNIQNCRVYEKSDLRTCRIGVIVYVGQACFPYMQNWGPNACRCGMFFVQGGPEPALYILLQFQSIAAIHKLFTCIWKIYVTDTNILEFGLCNFLNYDAQFILFHKKNLRLTDIPTTCVCIERIII